MELSPNYAGTLRGFTNTFGNMTGFVAPLFAGSITNQNVSKALVAQQQMFRYSAIHMYMQRGQD